MHLLRTRIDGETRGSGFIGRVYGTRDHPVKVKAKNELREPLTCISPNLAALRII